MGDTLLWEFIKAVFLFGIVIVLAWFTTRFVGLRMGGAVRGRSLRVLEHVPAGRDRSVMLLEVGGRVYLVGSTAQQVTLLDAIDDPDVIDRIMKEAPDPALNPLSMALPQPFQELLARASARAGSGPVEPPPVDENARRVEEQIERLRRLQGNK